MVGGGGRSGWIGGSWFCHKINLIPQSGCDIHKKHPPPYILQDLRANLYYLTQSYNYCFTGLDPNRIPTGSYRLKRSWTFSATIFAIAKEDVAPGEGAFLTCRTRLPMSPAPPSNTKSSTKFPSRSIAWARTPAGPLRLVEKKTWV